MDNKSFLITLLIIILAALGITGFAAVSSFNITKKLTDSVNEIQNKQDEMEGRLGEIASKADNQNPENLQFPQDQLTSDAIYNRTNKKIQEAGSDCTKFTDEEIKLNVYSYLNIVFGDKKPTIKDYSRLEGVNSEGDLSFLMQECASKGWDSLSKECARFLENYNPEGTSLYFSFLRDEIKERNQELRIIKIIHKEPKKDEINTTSAEVQYGKNVLYFQHTESTCDWPVGFIMLEKINNKTISELIKEKLGWEYIY